MPCRLRQGSRQSKLSESNICTNWHWASCFFRFQRQNGRHMHWEQPARSLMTRSPMLREVMENTYLAQFDMCRVGGMRDPVNQLLYKKGMEILTTSYQLYSQLHGRKCNHLHQHQTLEGETMFKGHSMRRTEFSENYTRKFARTLAQVLTKVKMIKEAPLHVAEHEPSFAKLRSQEKIRFCRCPKCQTGKTERG